MNKKQYCWYTPFIVIYVQAGKKVMLWKIGTTQVISFKNICELDLILQFKREYELSIIIPVFLRVFKCLKNVQWLSKHY